MAWDRAARERNHHPLAATPILTAFDRTLEAYRALEALLADGKVRAIGVSNFMVEHLTTLLDRATVVPAVNQIEVHPYFAQREVQEVASTASSRRLGHRSAASPFLPRR